MNNQTAFESLAESLATYSPRVNVSIDPPAQPNGSWFLDARLGDRLAIVEWHSERGFGVSCASNHGYGEAADEHYASVDAARFRVLSLLLSDTETVPPTVVRLPELRKLMGVSQIELAELLNIQQGAVSRLERRSDVLLSSVRDYVNSLGGQLRLMATFPDGQMRFVELEDAPGTEGPAKDKVS